MIELKVAKGCAPTARVLERLLLAEGAQLGAGGHQVSWGVPMAHGLNRNASRLDKLQQLERLKAGGVLTPYFIAAHDHDVEGGAAEMRNVYLARKLRHQGGKDIMPVLQFEDFAARRAAGADFFTRYVPSSREFRCWIYRKRHLGSYEKLLKHPQRYRKIGRNYDNGFAFELLREDQIPRQAVEEASKAVDALALDFGAVDILLGKDGHYYVLEVNSAPGVEGEDRQVIRALAQKIARWDANGCPRRNGDEEAPRRQNAEERPVEAVRQPRNIPLRGVRMEVNQHRQLLRPQARPPQGRRRWRDRLALQPGQDHL